ncbi:hypothetical protein FRC03_006992 [Tulasnella sp. 419]|nr:hypothetical protein FRC03_006992 [Tulasnella sp. 419]
MAHANSSAGASSSIVGSSNNHGAGIGNSTNLAPTHILIARHPRTSMTHAALSSPTETHAAASGSVFPRSTYLSWPPETDHHHHHHPPSNGPGGGHFNHNRDLSLSLSDLDEMEFAPAAGDGDSDESAREPIEVDETFTKNARWSGNVMINVEATTFWAHKDILVFASPFFEAALSGCWAETGRPSSLSSVITISQPPTVPGSAPSTGIASASESVDAESSSKPQCNEDSDSVEGDSEEKSDSEEPEIVHFNVFGNLSEGEQEAKDKKKEGKRKAHQSHSRSKSTPDPSKNPNLTKEERDSIRIARERDQSLGALQGGGQRAGKGATQEKKPFKTRRGGLSGVPEATIHLREEKAPIFHDFLKHIYPHLECTITWYNVEGLMNISHKLVVPSLQKKCMNFLLTHAAGKPIKAMRIAELFEEDELYREASRFVLENPGGWAEWELSTLSPATLLKLERRRTWFLERVLKLGLVSIAKEYQCCPTCPDPATCARMLEEKWRQNYNSLFRFGPVQPSMVYRYLRSLEVSPPLLLTQLSCQMFAKNWIASLFDRMFSLGVHMTPVSGRGVVATPGAAGPRRHFLYCTLKDEKEKKDKRGNRSNWDNQRSGLSLTRGLGL